MAPLDEQVEEETDPEEMMLDPDTDAALAEQADLAMAQQQEQPLTDVELEEHATRLAAQVLGMLAHLPVRRQELPTPMLEAFLEECLEREERKEEDEEEGKEEEQETQSDAVDGASKKRKHEDQDQDQEVAVKKKSRWV